MNRTQSIPVVIPDLGLGELPLRVTVWHVGSGQSLQEGDRLVEIAAPNVVVEIPAPASGTLRRRLVGEDDPVVPGQTIAVIDCPPG